MLILTEKDTFHDEKGHLLLTKRTPFTDQKGPFCVVTATMPAQGGARKRSKQGRVLFSGRDLATIITAPKKPSRTAVRGQNNIFSKIFHTTLNLQGLCTSKNKV